MNMGLHSSQDNDEDVASELDELVDLTNELAESRDIKMIYHLPTNVNELAVKSAGKLENRHILTVIQLLRNAAPHWPAVNGHLLDLYNYTLGLHQLDGEKHRITLFVM